VYPIKIRKDVTDKRTDGQSTDRYITLTPEVTVRAKIRRRLSLDTWYNA